MSNITIGIVVIIAGLWFIYAELKEINRNLKDWHEELKEGHFNSDNNNWFKIIAILILLFALGQHPYGYYQLLRWVVSLAGAYSAYLAYEAENKGWLWIFVTIAILFNPIIPFYLARETWQILDVLVAIIFGVSLFAKLNLHNQK